MKILLLSALIASAYCVTAGGNSRNEGFAIVKNDTIYGEIKINFDYGSIVVKQDSINRMFLNDIQSVTLLNETTETYYAIKYQDKNTFFKVLVDGENPLFEFDNGLYTKMGDVLVPTDEKVVSDLFGKKEVKDYVFVRNISLDEKSGLIDLFKYFNNYKSS